MIKMNSKKVKLLFLGYAGHRNFGDDLLVYQAYKYLKKSAIITIHTTNVEESSDYLKDWFSEAIIHKSKVIKYSLIISNTHILYFGGGIFFNFNKINFFKYLRKKFQYLN